MNTIIAIIIEDTKDKYYPCFAKYGPKFARYKISKMFYYSST